MKLSQSSIAELVGGNRSSVNRVLKRFEEQELLLAGYGQIQILDKASLDKIAGL